MKVEFWCSPTEGPTLTVSASEFLKAKQSDDEFASLCEATDAFFAFYNADCQMTGSTYDYIAANIAKGDLVRFLPMEDGCTIIKIRDNHSEMLSSHVHGHTRVYGKFNPDAIKKIQARHDKEAKKK